MNIPRNFSDNDVYLRWRDKKLEDYPSKIEDLTVKVDNPGQPDKNQMANLKNLCCKANIAIYQAPEEIVENKNIPLNMGASIGLKNIELPLTTEEDGVSKLSVTSTGTKSNYIPYSNKPLGWHTDGCYNDKSHLINGFILHCVRPAENGGENHLLDPDVAYILLRDENPEFIDGLMLSDALTIPQNKENGRVLREQQIGPALTIQADNYRPKSRTIHLRYTSRKTFAVWKNDARTQGALDFLRKTLQNKSPYIFCVKLKSGSGLIGNNILHNRTKFKDGDGDNSERLVYRIYYRDRVTSV